MDVEEWLEIHRRHRAGVPIRQIARDTSLSRNTVRRALARDTPPGPRTRRSTGSAIDVHEPRIIELLRQDPTIGTAEIGRRIGWARSHTVLKDHVRTLRAQVASSATEERERHAHPADLTSLVGRHTEIAGLCELLSADRLVTLSGPGGVGKTRLAARAAAGMRSSFPGGVWTIHLESLNDPTLVAQSLLDTLRIADRGRSTGDPVLLLAEFFEQREALLVLDNCEHLLDAVTPLVADLLRRAPDLTVLATSRQVLGVPGEHLVVVAPLQTPAVEASDLASTLASPAATLFADRAAAVLPGFAVTEANHALVAQLCRVLEGIPLAIELATVRLRVLSPAELLDHLHHRFSILTEGSPTAPDRQRTLQRTIEWSYDLCTAHERRLWARASVFAGGFDVRAATAVCAGEQLPESSVLDAAAGLLTKSILVREEHGGHVRFRMLESIREFGQAQLPDEETRELHVRHRAWCTQLMDDFVAAWFGPDQLELKRRMRREQANLRAALERALQPEHRDAEAAQRLVGVPWFLWASAFSLTEHRQWLERSLQAGPASTPARARALVTCGFVAAAQGDHDAARAAAAEGRRTAEELELADTLAFAVHITGLVCQFTGLADDARRLLNDALERYTALAVPDHLVAALETHLGMFHLSCGDADEAAEHFRAVLERCEAHGERWARTFAVDGIGYIALAREDIDGAAAAAQEGVELALAFDDAIGLAFAIELVAWTSVARGRYGRAAVLLGAASSLWDSFGRRLYGSRFWQGSRETYIAAASAALGPEAFDAAHRHGAGLRRTDAGRLALEPGDADPSPAAVTSQLSRREREVVELVARGRSNREIAGELHLSPRTVEGHVSHALEKLGLRRRGQLAVWAAGAAAPRSAGPR